MPMKKIKHCIFTRDRHGLITWHDVETPIFSPSKEISSNATRKEDCSTVFLRGQGWRVGGQDNHNGMPLVDFLDCGDTVTAECYCSTLQRLWQVIYHKRPWLTYQDIIILYDHVRPKIASYTCDQLWYYGWEDMDHPCYSLILHPVISISLDPFRSIWHQTLCNKSQHEAPCYLLATDTWHQFAYDRMQA